jgi:hypothetical protein
LITYNGHSKVVMRLCEAVNKLEEKVGAIKDTDTTYTLSIDGNKLTLTPSSGEPQTIELPTSGTASETTDSGTTDSGTTDSGTTDTGTDTGGG